MPVQPIDNLHEWAEIVRTRSGWLFPDLWRMADWQYHALVLLTLVLAARFAIDPRTKDLATCSLWLGLAGIGLAFIAGALTGHPILLRIQPWRWMWVACFFAIIFLPLAAQGLWRQGAGAIERTSAILLAAAWLLADSVGGFLAIAALAVLYLPASVAVSSSVVLRRGAWAVLTLACLTNVLRGDPVRREPVRHQSGFDAGATRRQRAWLGVLCSARGDRKLGACLEHPLATPDMSPCSQWRWRRLPCSRLVRSGTGPRPDTPGRPCRLLQAGERRFHSTRKSCGWAIQWPPGCSWSGEVTSRRISLRESFTRRP